MTSGSSTAVPSPPDDNGNNHDGSTSKLGLGLGLGLGIPFLAMVTAAVVILVRKRNKNHDNPQVYLSNPPVMENRPSQYHHVDHSTHEPAKPPNSEPPQYHQTVPAELSTSNLTR
ncbi:hypothetical protein PMZ80_011113 [Knufia obscura]|uniref:Transmembrane protein n=1 Tax=Knufia obscura TaxID=1635080 RepID=A0ABR0R8N2_9EURO|nr:hypothetical protein PMZ80_011113 [Knufia obscura]